MKEHPILFSTEMVKAILDDRKAMTRRVIKGQQRFWKFTGKHPVDGWWFADADLSGYSPFNAIWQPHGFKCPYGQAGDRLWVREQIWNCAGCVAYVDGDIDVFANWIWKRNTLPSIHMPKRLTRLWLEITNIRVERLQEITEEDALREGVVGNETDYDQPLPSMCFASLWDTINGKTYPWSSNPWVWVLEFKLMSKYIAISQ